MGVRIPVRVTARSKYRAVRTEVDGIVFASKREAKRYSELKLLEKAGQIKQLQTQVPYRLEVNGDLICKYICDFRYYDYRIGREIIEDSKGHRTRDYIIKAKLMKACYGITIQEV